jgi:hypothetical protein
MKKLGFDGWDVAGAAGVALVISGVRAIVGWPWASILLGAMVLGVYIIHEVRGGSAA